jgi:acetyl-CoA carboxylase carboxyl transferase alpha subunit/acetyl-CoA carboxylase carboxyl transferase beta subunit
MAQEDLWVRCRGCGDVIYGKRFGRDLHVCPGCGRHGVLSARERVEQLLDPGTVTFLTPATAVEDPLGFVDERPYTERLRAAREKTGLDDAILCLRGSIGGEQVVVGVMDFRFMGGSLGVAVGQSIVEAAELARSERVPLVLVTASGGARMQEGALALMQMAKVVQALAELDEAGLLTISLITDPTYGGVAASYATLADIVVAEPGARMGFAGPRVIEQTIRQILPAGFQTAEFLLAHGLVDIVQPRAGLRPLLARLLAARRATFQPASGRPCRVVRRVEDLDVRDATEVVGLARHDDRPSTLDYARDMLSDFAELHGDRMAADCPAIVGGIGRLSGLHVMLIGHEKGRDLRERVRRNFGMASPAGYRKAARLMTLAAKLGLPVITLINTPGADPSASSEEHGQAAAIAQSLRLMCGLPVPVVAVVTGEGGSGGALAIGVANRVLAMENSVYSVISPEGCAAILWKSPKATAKAAAALRLDARELLRSQVVDGVILEPEGGAHRDPLLSAEILRSAVSAELAELSGWGPGELLLQRRRRFQRFGLARMEEAANA